MGCQTYCWGYRSSSGLLGDCNARLYLCTCLHQGPLEKGQGLQPALGIFHLLQGGVLVQPLKNMGQLVVIAVRVLINHCEDPAVTSLHAEYEDDHK